MCYVLSTLSTLSYIDDSGWNQFLLFVFSKRLVSEFAVMMKVKELHHSLQTEKASRTDLEMYVAVLNTQKGVLQEDVDKLRSQLHERKPQS